MPPSTGLLSDGAEIMDNTEWAVKLSEAVRQAFMAGYREGYDNGMSDATSYERGHSKHTNVKKKEKAQAYQDFLDDPDW